MLHILTQPYKLKNHYGFYIIYLHDINNKQITQLKRKDG